MNETFDGLDMKGIEMRRQRKLVETSASLPEPLTEDRKSIIDRLLKMWTKTGKIVKYNGMSIIDAFYILTHTDSYLDADEQAVVIRKCS